MTDAKARLIYASSKRLGFAGYCRILSGIMSRPGTGAELASRFEVSHCGMNHVLRSMHRMRLIHKGEFVRPKAHSVLVPVWRAGQGVDATPEVAAPRRSCRAARGHAITLGTIAEILADGPMPMRELAQEVGLHRETVTRLVRIMRDHGLARVADWEVRENGGAPSPMYAYGRGPNKRRPPANTERNRVNARKHVQTHAAKRKHLQLIHAMAGTPRSVFDLAEAA